MSNVRILSTLTLILALLAPSTTHAAVRINEIAWMGSADNANAEWIELYNDGEEVSLDGWKVLGTTLSITLTGTVAAGAWYLLERTSDATVPSVTADQIYTGALTNSGDTLFLKDASGAVIDEVAGGSNWSGIGGDNVTKHTAQRTSSSWVTAAGTPRALNATDSTGAGDDTATTTPSTDTSTTTPSVTVGGSTPQTGTPAKSPARVLNLDAGDNRIVLRGVPTPFEAVAYNDKGTQRDARITWSFGDGTRDLGKKVWHTYHAPGEYAVMVRAQEDEAKVLRTLYVVVEDARLSVLPHALGVSVTNISPRLVDLSHWRLAEGEREFVLPEDTAILPGGTSVFASEVTGLTGEVSLLTPKGEMFATLPPAKEEDVQPETPRVGIPIVQTVELSAPTVQDTEDIYDAGITAPTAAPLQAAVGAAVPPFPWLPCLFGGLLACSASFVVR